MPRHLRQEPNQRGINRRYLKDTRRLWDNLYIKTMSREPPLAAFLVSSSSCPSPHSGEICEILRRQGPGSRTVAHSFIYFLTYRCTRSCSRFIGAGSSPLRLHPDRSRRNGTRRDEGPSSEAGEMQARRRPRGETRRKTKMDFLVGSAEKRTCARSRAPFSESAGDRVGRKSRRKTRSPVAMPNDPLLIESPPPNACDFSSSKCNYREIFRNTNRRVEESLSLSFSLVIVGFTRREASW